MADDLFAFHQVALDALVIPKAESTEDVFALGEQMDALGYRPDVELWLMAETPKGVLNARAHDAKAPTICRGARFILNVSCA